MGGFDTTENYIGIVRAPYTGSPYTYIEYPVNDGSAYVMTGWPTQQSAANGMIFQGFIYYDSSCTETMATYSTQDYGIDPTGTYLARKDSGSVYNFYELDLDTPTTVSSAYVGTPSDCNPYSGNGLGFTFYPVTQTVVFTGSTTIILKYIDAVPEISIELPDYSDEIPTGKQFRNVDRE
jgi:hypothetical protein